MTGKGSWVVGAIFLTALVGCSSEPKTEIRYVPVPVPAQEQPDQPNPFEEDAMRAEIVCDANGGAYYAGQCNYFGGDDPGEVPCDSAFEQRSYTCDN